MSVCLLTKKSANERTRISAVIVKSCIATLSLHYKLVVIFVSILSLDPEQPEVGTDPSLATSVPPAGFAPTSSMVQENVELVQSDEEGDEV